MLTLRARPPISVLCALVAGAALRLFFVHTFPQVQGDTLLYADIARNWANHGIYGRTLAPSATIAPTLVRLPGYPAFLALCFALFGQQNYQAVLYVQIVIDLVSCLLIAAFVRELCGRKAAMAALWLAVLCPFTANYVAMPLTETLSIFCVALGLYAFHRVVRQPAWASILLLAFAWSYAALLRPDGALLAVAFFPAWLVYTRGKALRYALLCALLSILPFLGWTLRNWHTFHVFAPLAPRSAADPGEPTAEGFQRWCKTWITDFTSTYEVYWNVPGDAVDPAALPARAKDAQAFALIDRYNHGYELTPQLDAAFGALAAESVRDRPFRYYVTLPLARLANMWLRPRVEMLNIELRWWQFDRHRSETEISLAYGALNLAYLLLACIGAFRWPRYTAAMLAFLVLRSLLLATLDAPEPRYTLEAFPLLIAWASVALVPPAAPLEKHCAGAEN
jgi:hypothetical protein